MSKNKWNKENIPGQAGRIIIVTGSSSGIGYEAAKALAEKGGRIIMAVRDTGKGEEAAARIRKGVPDGEVTVKKLDLADLSSVKQFAEEFAADNERLDILINNAGVMIPPYSKTKDGFELQMGTNHLGHFALTVRLLDHLKKTPGSRVVNVSSNAHKIGKIDFEDIHWEKRKYSPVKAYGDSKIANIYFTTHLAKKLEGKIPIVVAAHPGYSSTDLMRHSKAFEFVTKFFAQDAVMGALPTLYAATAEDVHNGDYYGPDGFMEQKGYPKKTETTSRAKDEKIAEKLWKVSEELTKVTLKE
ncbi:MAG: oxidoreductase [Ignavibacteriaceae bacterium]